SGSTAASGGAHVLVPGTTVTVQATKVIRVCPQAPQGGDRQDPPVRPRRGARGGRRATSERDDWLIGRSKAALIRCRRVAASTEAAPCRRRVHHTGGTALVGRDPSHLDAAEPPSMFSREELHRAMWASR